MLNEFPLTDPTYAWPLAPFTMHVLSEGPSPLVADASEADYASVMAFRDGLDLAAGQALRHTWGRSPVAWEQGEVLARAAARDSWDLTQQLAAWRLAHGHEA